jgi:hypothetical protein
MQQMMRQPASVKNKNYEKSMFYYMSIAVHGFKY